MPVPTRSPDEPQDHSSIPSTVPPEAGQVLVDPRAIPPSFLPPKVTGYEQLRLLGEGGMGVVFCGQDVRLKRPVALKMIKAGMLSPERLARFRTEAEALGRLQHPHIVQVFAWEEHVRQPILVLEFVSGGTLEDVLQGGRQSVREAVRLVAILARAVHVAHQSRVIHRDLKPANVLMAPPVEGNSGTVCGGFPKISDFGLCQLADAGGGRTGTGVILGTPAYMAPEQASGSTREIGPPVDVWALGVILFRALTGQAPFTGKGPLETMQRVISTPAPRPSELIRGLPSELEAICMACLRKESAKRPSAGDLGRLLEQFLASGSGSGRRPPSSGTIRRARRAAPPPSPPPRPWRRSLRRLLILAALGAVIGGGLGIALRLVFFSRGG